MPELDVTPIIELMREKGYCLRLVSTVKGSPAKFSAHFYEAEMYVLDHGPQPTPTWDEVAHGDTIGHAVMAAYVQHLEESNVLSD
jgi:hypothetical protein